MSGRMFTSIKMRVPDNLHRQLEQRADEAKKPVSTFAREQLERAMENVQQSEELAELRGQMQELVALVHTLRQSSPALDAETQAALHELRLIVRELAMNSNAQILARVAAQLKTQP